MKSINAFLITLSTLFLFSACGTIKEAYHENMGKYHEDTNKEEALIHYKEALLSDPINEGMLLKVAQLSANLYQIDSTLKYVNKLLVINSKNIKALLLKVDSFFQLKEYELCLSVLYQVKTIKDNADVNLRLGALYAIMHNYDSAVLYYTQGVAIDSTNSEGYRGLCESYSKLDKYEKAISNCDTAIRNNPQDIYGYISRGHVNLKVKKYEKSLQDVVNAKVIDPYSEYAFLLKAAIYYDKKEYSKGIDVLLKGIKKHPQQQTMLYNLACDYSLVNDIDNALFYLDRAMEQGFTNWSHIENDPDFDPIRGEESFKRLISTYSQKDVKFVEYGTINDSIYSNSYLKLNMVVPPDWYVPPDSYNKALLKTGKSLYPDSSNVKAMFDSKQTLNAILITLFENKPGTPTDFNANLVLMSENMTSNPGVETGSDYLFHARKLLQDNALNYNQISEEFPLVKIHDQDFYYLHAKLTVINNEIEQMYYTTIKDHFAVSVVITYETEEQKQILLKSVQSLTFN
ncbi:MAG: hypothetical protein OCD01_05240 [Fibrobacterales bacterium]